VGEVLPFGRPEDLVQVRRIRCSSCDCQVFNLVALPSGEIRAVCTACATCSRITLDDKEAAGG
jgi:hypothetical protein